MICYPELPEIYYYREDGDIATDAYGIEGELVMWCWPHIYRWEFKVDITNPVKRYKGNADTEQDCYDAAAAVLWLGAFDGT